MEPANPVLKDLKISASLKRKHIGTRTHSDLFPHPATHEVMMIPRDMTVSRNNAPNSKLYTSASHWFFEQLLGFYIVFTLNLNKQNNKETLDA